MNPRLIILAILCSIFGLTISVGDCDNSKSVHIDITIRSAEAVSFPTGAISMSKPSGESGDDYTGISDLTFSTANVDGCTLSAYDTGKMKNSNGRALTNPLQIEFPSDTRYQDLNEGGVSPVATSDTIYPTGTTPGEVRLLQMIVPYNPQTDLGDPSGEYSDTITIYITPVAPSNDV